MKQSRSSWNTELSRKTTHIKPAHKQINTCLSSPLRVWSPHVPLRPGKQGPWALGLCVETGSCAFLSEPVNPEAWPCLPQWTQTCSNFSCHFGLAVRVSHTTQWEKRCSRKLMLQTASHGHQGPSCGNEIATQPLRLVYLLHFSTQTEQQRTNSMKTSSWKKNSPWHQNLAPAHHPWFPSRDPCAPLCFNFGGKFSSLHKSSECRILSFMSTSLSFNH